MKWFKHDSDASLDAKLQELLLDYGAKGYGLYWYCVELIAKEVTPKNFTFELEHDARIIARNLNLTPKETMDMMHKMVKLGLFDVHNEKIRCIKLAYRLDEFTRKNADLNQVLKSFKNQDFIRSESGVSQELVQTVSEHTPETLPHRRDKKRIEENRRDKIRKEKNNIYKAKSQKEKDFFSLTQKAQYENLSKEYKERLKAKILLLHDGYRYEDFIDQLIAKGYTYKNFYAAYISWFKKDEYFVKRDLKHIKDEEIDGITYKVFKHEDYIYAINPKTFEMLPPKKYERKVIEPEVVKETTKREIDLSSVIKRM